MRDHNPRIETRQRESDNQGPPRWLAYGFISIIVTGLFAIAAITPRNEVHHMAQDNDSTILITGDLIVTSEPGEPLRFSYEGQTFDTALPQQWVDTVEQRFGVNPVGHVVWLYPKGNMLGHPAPTDTAGLLLLSRVAGAL